MADNTAPQGLASFPGLNDALIIGAEFTLSPGITPSTCLLTMIPQPGANPKPGTLKFSFGNVKLEFPDSAVDIGSMQLDRSGQFWQLRILDRRWKWKWGSIDGRYNYRRPGFGLAAGDAEGLVIEKGYIDPGTEKTPRELAKLLYKAMGEPAPTDKQIAALPNDTRPERVWYASNPAQELASLCDEHHCRVVLKLDNKVWICKNGEGEKLPAGESQININPGVQLNLRPDVIRVVCGPTQFQLKFTLEAVGEEPSGKIVPIDELSYRPELFAAPGRGAGVGVGAGMGVGIGVAGGPKGKSTWRGQWPNYFDDVRKVYEKDRAGLGIEVPLVDDFTIHPDDAEVATLSRYAHCRDLAIKTVWRWYRVKELSEGGFTPFKGLAAAIKAGGAPIKALKQLLPLGDTLVDAVFDKDEVRRTRPAYVEGRFFNWPLCVNSHSERTEYPGGFSINREKGIVMFSEPVAMMTVELPDGSIVPEPSNQKERDKLSRETLQTGEHDKPILYLVTTVNVRLNDTSELVREIFERKLAGPPLGTGARILHHDEIVGKFRFEYDQKNPKRPKNVVSNFNFIDKAARNYLDAAEKEYRETPIDDKTYNGLLKIDLDGTISQVTWTLGRGNPATTRASRNVDHAIFVPSFDELRRRDRLNELARKPGEPPPLPDSVRRLLERERIVDRL